MIEPDKRSIGAFLSEHGVALTELSVRDGRLLIGLPDAPYLPIETLCYVKAMSEVLGLSGVLLIFCGETYLLE